MRQAREALLLGLQPMVAMTEGMEQALQITLMLLEVALDQMPMVEMETLLEVLVLL